MLPGPLRVALCLLSPWLATTQTIPEIASQAAARISSLLPPRATVSLEFENLRADSAAEFSAFRTALETEIKKTGIEIQAATQPEARVRVAVSENVHGALIAGEVRIGEKRQAFFLPWMPPRTAAPGPRVRIERKMIFEQSEPILDFASLNSASQLLILGAGKISMYQFADGTWKPAGSVPLVLTRPAPRDPRGRLTAEGTVFRAYVPGTTCTGSAHPPLGVSCAPGNETWANVRWVSDRNSLEISEVQGTFYSAVPAGANGHFLLATLDATVRDQAGGTVAGAGDWGSDFAAATACGLNLIVAARKSDDLAASDFVQAFEIVEGSATPVSEPFPLDGPVTALWPSETPDQISIVVRNSGTGEYEASRLRLACAE